MTDGRVVYSFKPSTLTPEEQERRLQDWFEAIPQQERPWWVVLYHNPPWEFRFRHRKVKPSLHGRTGRRRHR